MLCWMASSLVAVAADATSAAFCSLTQPSAAAADAATDALAAMTDAAAAASAAAA